MFGGKNAVEAVYNLIDPERQVDPLVNEDCPLISSQLKFRFSVRPTTKEGKHEHRTMGDAEESLLDRQQFLQKHPNLSKGSSGEILLSGDHWIVREPGETMGSVQVKDGREER